MITTAAVTTITAVATTAVTTTIQLTQLSWTLVNVISLGAAAAVCISLVWAIANATSDR